MPISSVPISSGPTSPRGNERFRAVYRFTGSPSEAHARAEAVCIEQTVEYPPDLVTDPWIRGTIFGRIEAEERCAPDASRVTISYAVDSVGTELTQLLNVLLGNASLLTGVRLEAVQFPPQLLAAFRGPRFGVTGLRAALDAPSRPLLASAIKPMGLSPNALAELAGALAEGGVDIVKDDHGLADQPFCRWEERVARVADAVWETNERCGTRCLYAPNITGPGGVTVERARAARRRGAGALLVAPGLVGFGTLRAIADDPDVGLPLLMHPAFLGSFVTSREQGIAHRIVFGTFARLAGADATVFPSFGGRFAFSEDDCRSLAAACHEPLGELATILPSPAGGMTLERVPELRVFYGDDVLFLIGGDLHRGDDLVDRCQEFRELVS